MTSQAEESESTPLTLTRVVQTCFACPSQWDGWDAEGNYYYLRYRYGHGQVRHYKTSDWPDEEHAENLVAIVADFSYGHSLDGVIELAEFAQHAGIIISPEATK